ncbi:hypothetical protein MAPG_00319 [Magnaporthiopsis poae ATCC 64411]|uniref:Uncharacterized protein n=1 Tax=Magnaporthiopsis poae (strain ATCC 64411 / 73-15) TaxID=644358 RepID=A0A0C4DKP1_MAGP6|nr:hypothetical protein MAPG_00319 [Magnaporthiopsis poae ATCC 64411]
MPPHRTRVRPAALCIPALPSSSTWLPPGGSQRAFTAPKEQAAVVHTGGSPGGITGSPMEKSQEPRSGRVDVAPTRNLLDERPQFLAARPLKAQLERETDKRINAGRLGARVVANKLAG